MVKGIVCAVLLCALAVAGCSYAPQPHPRTYSSQETMEAAQHWQRMAHELVKDTVSFAGQRVYIPDNDTSTFGRAFSQMLKTEVLQKGALLSPTREGALCFDWGVQFVKYSTPRHSISVYPGTYAVIAGASVGAYYLSNASPLNWAVAPTMLTAAILDGMTGMYELSVKFPLDTEIIFTLGTFYGTQPVKRGIAIFYTRRSDTALYHERSAYNPYAVPVREKTFTLSNK